MSTPLESFQEGDAYKKDNDNAPNKWKVSFYCCNYDFALINT